MWHSMSYKSTADVVSDAAKMNAIAKFSNKEWQKFMEEQTGGKDEKAWYDLISFRR